MAARLRLVSLLAAVMLAVVIGAGSLSLSSSDKTEAHIVAGEFSLETTAPAFVALGSTFEIGVRNDHDGGILFDAMQWFVDYDETIMTATLGQTAASTRDPAVPLGICNSYNDNGVRTLLGCLDLSGPNITYSGNVWNVEYTCIAPSAGHVWTLSAPNVSTFVKVGAATQPMHIHEAVTACVPTADLETTKTATPFVVAGGVVSNTIITTNNGPQPATSVGIVDDLPDTGICIGVATPNPSCVGGPTGTVDVDFDGDSVYDIVAAPACAFLPLIPPLGPFPAITNGVVCPNPGPALAVNGSMRANIVFETTADSCNQLLIDLGAGVSIEALPFLVGPAIPDPDFFDGVDLPAFPGDPGADNNFAIGITQVGDCPVTIDKVAPAGGAVGDVLVFTIDVDNAGPSAATNVNVTDVVPAGLTVTSAVATGGGDCTATVGNNVDCTFASLASGASETITITVTADDPGAYCNSADATWVRAGGGADSDGPECFTIIPPFNGLVKSVDPDGPGPLDPIFPADGEDTILINLWLCVDQATDGVDNDGNSTVDDEDATCEGNGQGTLEISEMIFTSADCDTRNDDDDGDGLPVSNSPTIHPLAPLGDLIDNDGDTVVDEVGERDTSVNVPNPAFRPECPQPTLEDYIQGLVDKDGGELPEGLGAFEFQLKFDHKIFDISIVSATAWAAPGLNINCSMTLISENDIRFGCVTTFAPGTLGFPQVSGVAGATITVTPEDDLQFRIRPGKDNGVTRRLLDENCEVADIFGDIFPDTNAGLTEDCTDVDITVRRLEGDLDMDCDVDITDSQRIAFRYGSFFGQLLYNQIYDLEPFVAGDFDIDIKDLQFVFGRIGSTCADPLPNNQDPIPAEGVGQP